MWWIPHLHGKSTWTKESKVKAKALIKRWKCGVSRVVACCTYQVMISPLFQSYFHLSFLTHARSSLWRLLLLQSRNIRTHAQSQSQSHNHRTSMKMKIWYGTDYRRTFGSTSMIWVRLTCTYGWNPIWRWMMFRTVCYWIALRSWRRTAYRGARNRRSTSCTRGGRISRRPIPWWTDKWDSTVPKMCDGWKWKRMDPSYEVREPPLPHRVCLFVCLFVCFYMNVHQRGGK